MVRLKAALDSAMSLELGPRGLLVFEDYAKGNSSSSHLAQRKGIPGRADFGVCSIFAAALDAGTWSLVSCLSLWKSKLLCVCYVW